MAASIVSEKGVEQKIWYFALVARLAVIFIQIVFNTVLPDHDAGAFNPGQESTLPSSAEISDHVVNFLLGGFKRWDAVYFTHIAEYGYTFENTLAFFPFFPKVVAVFANFVLFPLHLVLNYSSVILISATIINVFLFIKTALNLYKLGKIVTNNDTIAYTAALLFSINPASVFMSAPYSECIYAYLTFTGLLMLEEHKLFSASVLFGLTCLTRSNGLMNLFYMAYLFFKQALEKAKNLRKAVAMNVMMVVTVPWIFLTTTLVPYCVLLLIGITPFILYQYYCFKLYCEKEYTFHIPEHLIQYAKTKGLKLPADEPSLWCNSTVPLAYSYIQVHHWDQGLFKYWQFKKIPNFILATPVTVLVFALAVHYFVHNRYVCITLGLDETGAAKKETDRRGCFRLEGVRLLPYVIHPVVLTVFGWFCIHVEVLTRLLFSSAPVLYWYAAYLVLGELPRQPQYNQYDIWKLSNIKIEKKENLDKPWKNLVTSSIANFCHEKIFTRLVLGYFLAYLVIGVAIFSNSLPWT